MKSETTILAFVLSLVALCVQDQAVAQISITTDASGKSRTFMAGQLSMSAETPSVEAKSFSAISASPLKSGDKVAAMVSDDQAWSVAKHTFQIGKLDLEYPVLAMVKCSDGDFRSLFPMIFKAKVDIKAGDKLHVDGYLIETTREIKVGESIPVIFVSDSLLSVERSGDAKGEKAVAPLLTVFKEDIKAEARSATIEAWRIERDHVNK